MTKFDQKSVGLQAIQILLPGTYSIYYGEEIQMKDNTMITYDDTVDPVAKKAGSVNYTRLSRDFFHTPMLWNSSKNYGNFAHVILVFNVIFPIIMCNRIFFCSINVATNLQQRTNS